RYPRLDRFQPQTQDFGHPATSRGRRRLGQFDQLPNVVQRQTQILRTANKEDLLRRFLIIDSMPRRSPPRFRQETSPFVKTDGISRNPAAGSQLPYSDSLSHAASVERGQLSKFKRTCSLVRA